MFKQYELEDGTVVTVQGQEPPPSSIEIPPSQEDVDAAAAAVQEQAAAVRQLKEEQGLSNQVGSDACGNGCLCDHAVVVSSCFGESCTGDCTGCRLLYCVLAAARSCV